MKTSCVPLKEITDLVLVSQLGGFDEAVSQGERRSLQSRPAEIMNDPVVRL